MIARERDPDLRVVVPNALRNPHLLVGIAANLLRKTKSQDAFVRRRLKCLDISATGDALERALRIMDALLRAMERRGFRDELGRTWRTEALPIRPAAPSPEQDRRLDRGVLRRVRHPGRR